MSVITIIFIGVAAVILLPILLRLILPGKGTLGEKCVSHILSKLPKERYEVFNDVMLKTGHGTTQIDHIVVSRYGVFVIETKSLSGWIYGSENDKYWTQNIYGNRIDTDEKGVKKAHKKSEKAAKKYSESRPFSKICPKCGGHLSLKHGKFGDFYGCSNYPKCSYTRRIN